MKIEAPNPADSAIRNKRNRILHPLVHAWQVGFLYTHSGRLIMLTQGKVATAIVHADILSQTPSTRFAACAAATSRKAVPFASCPICTPERYSDRSLRLKDTSYGFSIWIQPDTGRFLSSLCLFLVDPHLKKKYNMSIICGVYQGSRIDDLLHS